MKTKSEKRMNIDSLTIAQVKEIAAIAGSLGMTKCGTPRKHPFVGRYVIVRAYAAGVHAGELVSARGDVVILRNARRLWTWTVKAGVALSGLAVHGLKAGKVDTLTPEHCIIGVCEIIPCSDTTRESIHGAA